MNPGFALTFAQALAETSGSPQAAGSLAGFTGQAWAAFRTDCGYAAGIAQAAARRARLAHRQPGMVNPATVI